MSNTGRTDDLKELYHALDHEYNPKTRDTIRESIHTIKNESGSIKSMREALIRAHRSGDVREVKDIHDYIKHKSKYKNA